MNNIIQTIQNKQKKTIKTANTNKKIKVNISV